jgi:hypothetical protein
MTLQKDRGVAQDEAKLSGEDIAGRPCTSSVVSASGRLAFSPKGAKHEQQGVAKIDTTREGKVTKMQSSERPVTPIANLLAPPPIDPFPDLRPLPIHANFDYA